MVQVINRAPSIGGLLGELLGGGVGGALEGVSSGLQASVQDFFEEKKLARQEQKIKEQTDSLIDQGFTPQEAQLHSMFTPGGQTELAKTVLDRMVRESGTVPGLTKDGEGGAIDAGLRPEEKIRREESRYKTNLPLFQEITKKLEGFESEGMSIQRLQSLNESDKLPKGLQRWNIKITGDNQGELHFPWLASPETQSFIKVINDFTVKAKDSFGARVTNFELARFMKRLPGLLNSEEGRRRILRQMEIINQINTVHSQAILDTVEKRGGLRSMDYDSIERLARKESKGEIDRLKKEFISLETKSTPGASKTGSLKKVKKGTSLSSEEARNILQRAGGDKEKARELARKLGYEF